MLFSLGPGEEHVFLESVYLSFCEWHLAGEGEDNNIGSMWLMGAWEDSRNSLVGSPLQGPFVRASVQALRGFAGQRSFPYRPWDRATLTTENLRASNCYPFLEHESKS